MNFQVWYSSLANKEINEESCDKRRNFLFNFKIDFLHIPKGEEGINILNNKLSSYTKPVFTNGHSIPKYNPSIVENIKDKSFLFSTKCY